MSLKLHPASATSFHREPSSLKQLRTPLFSSQKNLSNSRYDNRHEKPSFCAPTPKILTTEDETEIGSFHLDAIDNSQGIPSYEKIIQDKSPISNAAVRLLFTNPISPITNQQQKHGFLGIEELSMDFELKASPKNGFSTPTIIKEIDSDRLSSHGSEIIQLTDVNQVDMAMLEHLKPGTMNMYCTTLVPSRFALDATSKNNLRWNNEPKSGDVKSKVLSVDEANQTIVTPGLVSPTSQVPKAKKKWRQLSHVLHSISLIQKPEAASITEKDVAAHIDKFQPRAQKEKYDIYDKIFRRDGTSEAFQMLRTIKTLCDCSKVGSPKHLAIMKDILANDTRKHLLESKDPEHLLNKYNTEGMPPICLGAQNGNLEVVQLLIENGADPLRETKASQTKKIKEVALALAVRWNHIKVVEYLLKKCVHPYQIVQNCLISTDNKNIKDLLMNYMRANNISPKKRGFCFGK